MPKSTTKPKSKTPKTRKSPKEPRQISNALGLYPPLSNLSFTAISDPNLDQSTGNLQNNLHGQNTENSVSEDDQKLSYINETNIESVFSQALDRILFFKPDDPLKFLGNYFKLSSTKEFPFSLSQNYQIKTILNFVEFFQPKLDQNRSKNVTLRKLQKFQNDRFFNNIKIAYNLLGVDDKITLYDLLEIVKILPQNPNDTPIISFFSTKLIHSYILNYSCSLSEPLDKSLWSYLMTKALIFVKLAEKIKEIFDQYVKKYRNKLAKSAGTIANPAEENYYSLPETLIFKFCKLVKSTCYCRVLFKHLQSQVENKENLDCENSSFGPFYHSDECTFIMGALVSEKKTISLSTNDLSIYFEICYRFLYDDKKPDDRSDEIDHEKNSESDQSCSNDSQDNDIHCDDNSGNCKMVKFDEFLNNFYGSFSCEKFLRQI